MLLGQLKRCWSSVLEGINNLLQCPISSQFARLIAHPARRTFAVTGKAFPNAKGAKGMGTRRDHGREVEVLADLTSQRGFKGRKGWQGSI
jgi:hypothetical protein